MTEVIKTQEELRIERVTREYIKLVKDEQDNIGLLGHQPRLRNIRRTYQAGDINENELQLVCEALATDLQGEAEPYKSIKDFAHNSFPGVKKRVEKQKAAVKKLTVDEQLAILKQMNKDSKQKTKSKPKTKKQTTSKPVKINKANLPACLKHLV